MLILTREEHECDKNLRPPGCISHEADMLRPLSFRCFAFVGHVEEGLPATQNHLVLATYVYFGKAAHEKPARAVINQPRSLTPWGLQLWRCERENRINFNIRANA